MHDVLELPHIAGHPRRHEMCIVSPHEGENMRKTIEGGTVETEIYLTEGGYVAIHQPAQVATEDQLCLLRADQLPELIRELQALYDDRRTWEEAAVD